MMFIHRSRHTHGAGPAAVLFAGLLLTGCTVTYTPAEGPPPASPYGQPSYTDQQVYVAPPPPGQQTAPGYEDQLPDYTPQPGYRQPEPYAPPVQPVQPVSRIACSIRGGEFEFPGNKSRQYQPVSFAVAPGETVEIPIAQDDNRRHGKIYVQGDPSGIGLRICRYEPPPAGSSRYSFGPCGGVVSTEPALLHGVSQALDIRDLFKGAKIECGYRSPPGRQPGSRHRYY